MVKQTNNVWQVLDLDGNLVWDNVLTIQDAEWLLSKLLGGR